ncbi:hypothetical protein KG088_18585 [Halomonas sp. TRM85114]|uniref:hypothetical protein n=1 Tax=Halomonas jincaotanensis TaxID=2810616 RepID=UPI001BD35491|nr:hypothetical protein [Halomonas jincaotanensis]MBS9405600.1 hypothetical protein [Halomonas jincaotanensis]
MEEKDLWLSEEFINASMRLRKLVDALDMLKGARIKCECNIEFCWELMRRGATGDDVAVHALEYAIRSAARQTRLSIAARPRWKKMMEDIQFGRNRVKSMRVLTYQALRPFAMKEFE